MSRSITVKPAAAAPGSIVQVFGVWLRFEPHERSAKILFTQGRIELDAEITASGVQVDDRIPGGLQYNEVVVPRATTAGTWTIVIDNNGRRSLPATFTVTGGRTSGGAVPSTPDGAVLARVQEPRAHPSQLVTVFTSSPPRIDDQLVFTDGRGRQWRPNANFSSNSLYFDVPEEAGDGDATLRIARTEGGVERLLAPLAFFVTSGPLPLSDRALEGLLPVAPGQWTRIWSEHEVELGRSDRVEIEFRQAAAVFVEPVPAASDARVRVPPGLTPGSVMLRSRTWIGQQASTWSAATPYTVRADALPPDVFALENRGQRGALAHPTAVPVAIRATPGDVLTLHGFFPVADPADLRVQLRRGSQIVDVRPTTGGWDDIAVELPLLEAGSWRLAIGLADGRVAMRDLTTIELR